MSNSAITKRVFVDPSKRGRRPIRSVAAQTDRVQATRIETTPYERGYTKSVVSPPMVPHGIVPTPTPSAPPAPTSNPAPPPTSVPKSPSPRQKVNFDRPVLRTPKPSVRIDTYSEPDMVPRIIAFVLILVVCAALWSSFTTPTRAVLTHVSWSFVGEKQQLQNVNEEGWSLPPNAIILSSTSRQRSTRSVLDHEDIMCQTVVVPSEVVDHFERRCHLVTLPGEEYEEYSHTEETCYENGQCEQTDIYLRIPPVDTIEEICEQVPVYNTIWTPHEECVTERTMRDEPVMGTYWTYTMPRWRKTGMVHLGTKTGDVLEQVDPRTHLTAGERYERIEWRYYLHFDTKPHTSSVTRAQYDQFKTHVGETVEVPSWIR